MRLQNYYSRIIYNSAINVQCVDKSAIRAYVCGNCIRSLFRTAASNRNFVNQRFPAGKQGTLETFLDVTIPSWHQAAYMRGIFISEFLHYNRIRTRSACKTRTKYDNVDDFIFNRKLSKIIHAACTIFITYTALKLNSLYFKLIALICYIL